MVGICIERTRGKEWWEGARAMRGRENEWDLRLKRTREKTRGEVIN